LARRVLVHLEHPIATVYEVQAARSIRPLFTFRADERGEWPEQDEGFASIQGARATLVLTSKEVLISDWTFPEAVQGELDQVIKLKLERELPIQPERVYVDHWISGRTPQQTYIAVRVLVAHRKQLERLRQLAHCWGVRPMRVALAVEPGRCEPIVGDLLPNRARLSQRAPTVRDRLLVRAAVALTLALVTVTGSQWVYERGKVGAEVLRVQTNAKSVRALARRLEHEQAPARALLDIQALPDAADLLKSLTETVPNDSWVYELQAFTPTSAAVQLELSAFAPAATVLADTLEKSSRFGKVRLVWASSAGLGTAMDRLQLTAVAGSPESAAAETQTVAPQVHPSSSP